MKLRRSSPQACWRFQRMQENDSVIAIVISHSACALPKGKTGAGFGSPLLSEVHEDHDGTSSPVVCGSRFVLPRGGSRPLFRSGSSAGVASGLARGWCWSPTKVRAEPAKSAMYGGDMLRELPPTGSLARHTHYHHRSDSAEALPFVVAHRRCSLFAAHRHLSAKTRRCASESPAFAPAPLCSFTRTSQGRRRECATTSREITTDRRAHFVPGST